MRAVQLRRRDRRSSVRTVSRGAPAAKLAISVDAALHASVVRAARADRMSVSAWMIEAARHALRIRNGLLAVHEWEAEHGRFSEREMRAARRGVQRALRGRPVIGGRSSR